MGNHANVQARCLRYRHAIMETGCMGAWRRSVAAGVFVAVATVAHGGCGLPLGSAGDDHMPTVLPDDVDDYDTALQRLRSGPCHGLFWRRGTCGTWLVLIESTGFSSVVSYFDSDTLELAGRTHRDDTGLESHDGEAIECDHLAITETNLCPALP